jgi:hypothetical protein
MNTNDIAVFKDLVGMTLGEARAAVKDRGINNIREIMRDGQPSVGTADYRMDRLNVVTCKGAEHATDVRITQIKGRG